MIFGKTFVDIIPSDLAFTGADRRDHTHVLLAMPLLGIFSKLLPAPAPPVTILSPLR